MAFSSRKALAAVAGYATTALVLAGLVALFVWGNRSGWKLDPSLFWWRAQKPEAEGGKRAAAEDDPLGPLTLGADDTADKAGFEVGEAKRRPVAQVVRATAVLDFDQTRYAHLSPRAAGQAWRVLKQVGDRVEKGEVLALVAAADVGKAKAELRRSLVQADELARRLKELENASDVIPQRQLTEARAALREARVRLSADRQALANLGLPVRAEDFKGLSDDAVARRLRGLGVPSELAGADEDDLPDDLLPLRAPFPGQVLRRDVVVGEVVTPDKHQFVVADLGRLWLLLDVRLEDAGRLAPGQPVTFRADASGQTARGKLAWVSPEVDPKTRTVRARAEVDNAGGLLRPATFGTAEVVIGPARDALTVPDRAVQWDGQAHRVFVRRDAKTYQPLLVLPAGRAGGYTELAPAQALVPVGVAGLLASPGAGPLLAAATLPASAAALAEVRPGDAVVTAGSHALKSELLKDRIGGED